MSDIVAIAEKTCDWLKKNPKEIYTPEHFFDVQWIRHKIVSVGERHDDAAQRDFIANRVKHWGGHHVALALEIQDTHQTKISQFIKGGGQLPNVSFIQQPKFRKILEAARATQTEVIAMDQTYQQNRGAGPIARIIPLERDKNMANTIAPLLRRKTKVLILVGMEHAREASFGNKPSLGARLTETIGSGIYTIYTMTQIGHGDPRNQSADPFTEVFLILKKAFGSRGSIAFDVDRSPLGSGQIPEPGLKKSTSWNNYCDGLILFFNG